MSRREFLRGRSEVVVFGRHPVEAALQSDGAEVLEVFVARGRSPAERKALRSRCEAAGVEMQEVSRDALSRISGAERHDQGIAARVRLLRVIEIDAFVASLTGRRARNPVRLLALDGVTNSQNVGMVVRSVAGAGLDGLLWPLSGQPWVNGLVVRAASGAIFECTIIRCETLVSGLASLQAAGFTCFGLAADADRSLFATDPVHRSAFVLGSESLGLSADVLALLDERVSIPMAASVESLNVAVAAGLVAFHAAGLLRPASDR